MLGIDCSKIEYRPTGIGRILLNVLSRWPEDVPATLYFRRTVPQYPFIEEKPFDTVLAADGIFSRLDPVWRHFVLPSALREHKTTVLFEPFYIPLLNWLPERTILLIADISYKRHPEWFPAKSQLRWFPDYLVKRVRHIMTISEFSKQEIMDYYGVPESQVTVAPLGVDEKFHPATDTNAPLAGRYVFFWGDISNRRHLPEVIDAFVRHQQKPSARQLSFVIVGRDITHPAERLGERMKKANKMLGRDAIVWQEYVSEEALLRYIQHAFAVIYLSDYEGFGLPVLEAMATGVPVITSRKTSIPEIAKEAVYYIHHNTEVEEIAWAFEALTENAWLHDKMRTEGIAAAKKFTWDKTAERIIKTLRRFA